MFALPRRLDRDERMPVVWRANQHCVQVFAGHEFAVILELRTVPVAVMVVHEFLAMGPLSFMHVANAHHPDLRMREERMEVVRPPVAQADTGHRDTDARRDRASRSPSRGRYPVREAKDAASG